MVQYIKDMIVNSVFVINKDNIDQCMDALHD